MDDRQRWLCLLGDVCVGGWGGEVVVVTMDTLSLTLGTEDRRQNLETEPKTQNLRSKLRDI